MKKPLNKKRPLQITILIILLLGSLAYAAYDACGPFELKKEIVPKYFDYGVITDSIYCNDFFGFRLPIPKGNTADNKIYDYTDINLLERDSTLAKPSLASDIRNHDLLVILPKLTKVDINKDLKGWMEYSSEKYRRESHGTDYVFIIRAHNLFGGHLKAYASKFSNIYNPNYGDSKTKTISGIEFKEYHGMEAPANPESSVLFQLMGGENKQIISYMAEINGFALSINLFYLTEEQKCMLLEMVDEISFH